MNAISRAALLQMLGWIEDQNHEGMLKWSKASGDMLSCQMLSVSQDEKGIKACLDFEGVDEQFNAQRRPILVAEFVERGGGSGSLRLSKFALEGAEPVEGQGGMENALKALAQARAGFDGKPKKLLLGPLQGLKMGAKL